MKYLVTGGAGFIGSKLIKSLLKSKSSIICLDNLTTGSKENIKEFADNPNFSFFEGDVRDKELVDKLVKQCQKIFHLAAAVGVKFVLEHPLETILTNVRGTEIVLEKANKYKKPVMVFSTSEVYGKNSKVPFKEDDDRLMGTTLKMRWSYAASKALDEFLSIAYHREKGLDVTIVRLFNTVGVGQVSEYGMVVPRFVRQALVNEDITVYGDGGQTRCFCNVRDVVKALLDLMQSENTSGEIFNIGSNERISILELAKLIIKLTNSKSRISLIPYEKALGKDFEDMRHRVPDITKIEKQIGFSPTYKIKDTIREVIDFHS